MRPDTEYAELDNDDEGQESLQTTDIPNSPEVSKKPVSQSFTQHNPTSTNDTPFSSAVMFAKPSRKKNIQPETAVSTLMKYILEKKKERRDKIKHKWTTHRNFVQPYRPFSLWDITYFKIATYILAKFSKD